MPKIFELNDDIDKRDVRKAGLGTHKWLHLLYNCTVMSDVNGKALNHEKQDFQKGWPKL